MFALFVCVLPRRARAHTHLHSALHLRIWIKYSLAVHLHSCMLSEGAISCFLLQQQLKLPDKQDRRLFMLLFTGHNK